MGNGTSGGNIKPEGAGALAENDDSREFGATEPVPESDRVLHFPDMVATWIGANANNGTWYVGGVVAGAAFSGDVFTTLVSSSDPSTIVSKLGLGVVAFLVIILTSTTANAVNLMAAGVSLTNITKSLKPLHAIWLATIVSALVTVIPLFLTSFLHAFILFLDYIGMVFGPLLSIVIVDYYLLCRGSYGTAELDERGGRYWYQGGYHLTAFAVWATGIVIFLVARNMPAFTSSVGAIYPSMLATGLIYYLAKRKRKTKIGLHEYAA